PLDDRDACARPPHPSSPGRFDRRTPPLAHLRSSDSSAISESRCLTIFGIHQPNSTFPTPPRFRPGVLGQRLLSRHFPSQRGQMPHSLAFGTELVGITNALTVQAGTPLCPRCE